MSESKSIMIVGVGGQGSLLASRILGNVLLSQGYDVKVSEVHGMSQRGGSVVTYVKYSEDKVYSPIVELGEADAIISFEVLEAARYVSYLKKGGKIIVSDQQIDPMPVITGAAAYPEDILDTLKQQNVFVDAIDALKLANEAGSSKTVNIVLMGRLAKYFAIPYEKWIAAMERVVKPRFLEMNQKAFALGYHCEG